MSLLPSRLEVSPSPGDPRVVDIDGDDAEATFDALGSETAREVLAAAYEEPRTPAEVRDEVGTSLQNVHYHIENLEDAGLIEPAGTGLSEKGNEVTVYAPASRAVVLFAGDDHAGARLRDRLKAIFGLAATVALATLVFAIWTDGLPTFGSTGNGADTRSMDAASRDAASTAAGVDPVVAFLLGGLVVVAVLALWWLLRPRLRSLAPSR
jgi:DNA-binding transcriptional ArsR family regulator